MLLILLRLYFGLGIIFSLANLEKDFYPKFLRPRFIEEAGGNSFSLVMLDLLLGMLVYLLLVVFWLPVLVWQLVYIHRTPRI
jgi:hypothetical protein